MSSTEKFCLRWNDFEANISSAFRELREDKDFFDVTLACVDDQIQAHKVILSACSPFFRGILRRNRHEHPLLYLSNVKYADLVAVLNFMYHGEVNVAQEELNSFLAVAEDLKVKGLTQNNAEKNLPSRPETQRMKAREIPERVEADPLPPPPPKRPRPLPSQSFVSKPVTTYQQDDDIQEVIPVKSEPVALNVAPEHVPTPLPTNNVLAEQVEDYGDQGIVADPDSGLYGVEDYGDYSNYEGTGDESMMEAGGTADANKDLVELCRSMSMKVYGENGQRLHQCTMCEYNTGNQTNMQNHIEKQHLNQSYFCPKCNKELQSSHALKTHLHRIHDDEPQVCERCNKIFPSKKKLRFHMKEQCSFVAV